MIPMGMPLRLALVAATVALAAGIGYLVVARGGESDNCPTCPKPGERRPPVEGVTPEGNSRIEAIRTRLMSQKALALEDAEFLRQTAKGDYQAEQRPQDQDVHTDDLAARRWAMAAIGDHLVLGTRMDDATRKVLEGTIIEGLSDPQWRIRSTSMAGVARTSLVDRQEVRARLRELRNDENPQVSGMAERLVARLEQGTPPPGG